MINPDEKLKLWLDDQITVQVSDTESRKVLVYHQGSRPNTDLPDEFIEVLFNGNVRSRTKPIGFLEGNLAVTIYCKANADGTAKFNRVKSIEKQLAELVSNKVTGGFFYELNLDSVIVPLQINTAIGYSTKTLNVAWHTSDADYIDMYVKDSTLSMEGDLYVKDTTLYVDNN